MNIADTLHDRPVSEVDLSRYVSVTRGDTVAATIAAMSDAGRSIAFVIGEQRLAGVLTQRDVLMKVLGEEGMCECPVGAVMTSDPVTMRPTDSVADGMAKMTEQWVRSIPVIGDDGAILGNFSYYSVMHLASELLSEKASRTEPELSAQHGLMFVDFTGLQNSPAVTVTPDDTVGAAVHQMRARATGIVVVVNERHHVLGTLSEFDLQTKVACRDSALETLKVEEVMTTDPITISIRSSVAESVRMMADHEVSHVALVGETGLLVGIASFRDVADYFDTSLTALG